MNRTFLMTTLAIFTSIIFTQTSWADRDCSTLLKGECVGCHEKEKYCDYLGKKEKFWKGMIALMESNGADLTKGERSSLIECLSTPTDIAKAVCK